MKNELIVKVKCEVVGLKQIRKQVESLEKRIRKIKKELRQI